MLGDVRADLLSDRFDGIESVGGGRADAGEIARPRRIGMGFEHRLAGGGLLFMKFPAFGRGRFEAVERLRQPSEELRSRHP